MSMLGTLPVFEATSLDQLEGAVEGCLGAEIIRTATDAGAFSAQGHRRQVRKTALWHCSYQIPVSLKLPESNSIRLQIPIERSGGTRIGNRFVPVAAGAACVSSGSVEIDFGPGYRQFVWLAERAVLEDKLRAMTGSDAVKAIAFTPELDLNSARSAGLRNVLSCLIRHLEDVPSDLAADFVAAELEQALMAAFLVSAGHNHSRLFEQDVPRSAPWQVRRAEGYMESHWQKFISVEELAQLTGTSCRSLFRTFREHRGYTPMDFLRRVRLNHARRMLEAADTPDVSVTAVAFACGFSDLGSFSRSFSKGFGMSPSVLLRRASLLR